MYRVYNLIVEVAEEHNINTCRKLAKYLGISQALVSSWSSGYRPITLEQALNAANLLCIPERDIVDAFVADTKDRMRKNASASA